MATFLYNMEGEKNIMQLSQHFSKREFDCQCGCGTGTIHAMLVQKLELVRQEYGKPMRINSGIRCLEHNRKIGSKDTSSHIKCLAADVGCTDMSGRFALILVLMKHFKRVGINKKFIHVDVDSDKPSGVFVY
jgi:uncharacterized protein YcbK (DUF882 family)